MTGYTPTGNNIVGGIVHRKRGDGAFRLRSRMVSFILTQCVLENPFGVLEYDKLRYNFPIDMTILQLVRCLNISFRRKSLC